VRLGYDKASAKDMQYLFCNEHIESRPQRHVMDLLLDFARALGIEPKPLRWDIPVEPSDVEFAEAALGSGPTVVISPCAVQRFRNYRNWRSDRYAAVADYASKRYGARVFLTGGSTEVERQVGEEICSAGRSAITNLIGTTSLKQLISLLRKTSVVICPDSGPAHMSTAVGTPVVGLYATTNRFRAGPYFSQHLVADRYPDAVRAEFGVPVEALPWGQRVRNPEAMDLITIDDVKEKLDMAFAEGDIKPVNAA
jgi:heptosyltransferase I